MRVEFLKWCFYFGIRERDSEQKRRVDKLRNHLNNVLCKLAIKNLTGIMFLTLRSVNIARLLNCYHRIFETSKYISIETPFALLRITKKENK